MTLDLLPIRYYKDQAHISLSDVSVRFLEQYFRDFQKKSPAILKTIEMHLYKLKEMNLQVCWLSWKVLQIDTEKGQCSVHQTGWTPYLEGALQSDLKTFCLCSCNNGLSFSLPPLLQKLIARPGPSTTDALLLAVYSWHFSFILGNILSNYSKICWMEFSCC